jgi:hypothetical protein
MCAGGLRRAKHAVDIRRDGHPGDVLRNSSVEQLDRL